MRMEVTLSLAGTPWHVQSTRMATIHMQPDAVSTRPKLRTATERAYLHAARPTRKARVRKQRGTNVRLPSWYVIHISFGPKVAHITALLEYKEADGYRSHQGVLPHR